MIASDTFHLALRNLRQAKLRTALTTLGVAIGIASLSGMVSLGVGLQDQFTGRFLKAGVFDAITVLPARAGGAFGFGGRAGGLGRRGGARASQPETPSPPLDDKAIADLRAIDGVKDVYPNVRVPAQIEYLDFQENALVTGVPMSARGEGAFQTLTAGSFLPDDASPGCMLSLDMAKRMVERDQDPKVLVGQTITLTYPKRTPAGAAPGSAAPAPPASTPPATGSTGALDQMAAAFQVSRAQETFTVVGIVERDPGAGLQALAGVSGVMISIPRAIAINTAMGSAQNALRSVSPVAGPPTPTSTYQTITVKVTQAQNTQDVEDKIKKLGYSAQSLNDALEGAKRAFIILDIVLSLIGSIALAVSSLGIVNTMVMSILERTREIGIMKAIGGSNADIRHIFLVEASAIGLLGGVCGVALGWTVGRIINFGANVYIQNQGGTPGNLFSLPLWLVASAIGFSIFVSLIAGSYPASRAARLDPIQALRHD